MYRLLAIAKYDERYVIPPAHAEQAHSLEELATECSLGLRGRPGHGRLRTVRRGLRRADADRGRELPDAPGPADLRHHGRPGRQGRAGEPAQLGRQGRPAGPVPAEGDEDRDEPRDARRPTLAGASSSPSPGSPPRCCSTTPTRSCLDRLRPGPRRPRERCPAAVGEPLRATRRTARSRRRSPSSQADYVETFDTRRRHNLFLTYFAHGDTRKRGVALLRFKQTYLRSGFVLDARPSRRRAARPPVRGAGVRRHRRPAARLAAAARPPGRAGAAPAVAARRRARAGPARSRRSPRRCRRCAATSGTPSAGSPPRDRRRRRSASTPYATPAFDPGPSTPGRSRPLRPQPLPMPTFPGGR